EALIAPLAGSLSPENYVLLHRIVVLMVLNLALLLVGLVIDVAPALLIVVPVLMPVSAAIGMDSGLAAVHFGVMVVSNLIIGVVTPPVGTTLFVAAGVGRVPPSEVIRYIFPFLGVMVLVQLIVTFVPAVTTALPSLM